ncbi:hypothetical protein HID58_002569, partial [Brassica napus]
KYKELRQVSVAQVKVLLLICLLRFLFLSLHRHHFLQFFFFFYFENLSFTTYLQKRRIMTMIYPPEDEIVGYYLKMMIDKRNEWPSNFLRSEDVYCVNPRTHFNTQEPLILHDGRYLFQSSGKTDGCDSGCWRIMGRDKLIKSEKNEEILGFKKVFKFCEKNEKKPKSLRDLQDSASESKPTRVYVIQPCS